MNPLHIPLPFLSILCRILPATREVEADRGREILQDAEMALATNVRALVMSHSRAGQLKAISTLDGHNLDPVFDSSQHLINLGVERNYRTWPPAPAHSFVRARP